MRIALGIEYDGSLERGWQRQEDSPDTIQQKLEEALAAIAGHAVELCASGRTDSGVHASGQVAHFLTTTERPFERWITGPNALLPPHIAVRWARAVEDETFHARHSAIARNYCYLLHNGETPLSPAATLLRLAARPTRCRYHAQRLAGARRRA